MSAAWVDAITSWLTELAGSRWLHPAVYLLTVGDAFLVVLPSEIAVATLASLAVTTGSPPLPALIAVAAAGALTGDLACYAIGRAVGLDRWRWQREGRLGAAVARVRSIVLRRPAVLIITARYIPFARIAVNLSVGAARLPLGRFLSIAAIAGLGWACAHAAIGTVLGAVLRDQPLVALGVTLGAALGLGLVVDRLAAWLAARRRAAARGKTASKDHGRGPDAEDDRAAS